MSTLCSFEPDLDFIAVHLYPKSGKLKEALHKSEKPDRKQQAASWKVFKSPDPAAGGNVLYVFMIDPAIKGGVSGRPTR